MYEDALAFPFLGTELYAYGLALMLGVWLGLAVLFALCRKRPELKAQAALTGALALPLGFVLARLLFCLGSPSFYSLMTLKNILDFRAGGFAMYGALAGAAASGLIAGRMLKSPAMPLLDRLTPALAAFLIPARLGEGFTLLGISRPLTTPWLAGSILAWQDKYDAYLRTYLIEALAALILLIILLRALSLPHRAGHVFLLGCLLYGVSQTLMESLRLDGHLRFGFVGVQQVLSAALFGSVLIALSLRALRRGGKRALPALALAAIPLVVGGAIALEFMIDRSTAGKWAAYGLYLPLLAIPVILGILLLKRDQEVALDQGTD